MINYCPQCGLRALQSEKYYYRCVSCKAKFNIIGRGDIPD